MRKSIQLRASCQFGAQRIYSPAFARLTNNDGLTPNALAIERSDSPFAWRLRTTSMSMSARFGPGTLPALRARSRPAFVRSEMLMRSWLREGRHNRDHHVAHNPARIEEWFHETSPTNAPAIEPFKVGQSFFSLPRATGDPISRTAECQTGADSLRASNCEVPSHASHMAGIVHGTPARS